MQDISSELIKIGLLVIALAIGAFGRQHIVFFRQVLSGKKQLSQYDIKHLIDSFIATIVAVATGTVSVFTVEVLSGELFPLAWTSIWFLVLAVVYGYFGLDVTLQVRKLLEGRNLIQVRSSST